jgi:hypothetical protein
MDTTTAEPREHMRQIGFKAPPAWAPIVSDLAWERRQTQSELLRGFVARGLTDAGVLPQDGHDDRGAGVA